MRAQRKTNALHGTATRYGAGCSCFECCNAWAAYQRDHKRDVDPSLVPIGPVLDHIAKLKHNGWRVRAIAEQSGVSRTTIFNAIYGRTTTMHRDNAAAIFALTTVPIPTEATYLVPARPTLLLIKRLNRDHSMNTIARECGLSSHSSLPRPGQHSVQCRIAKRVQDAAQRLRSAS